MKALNVIVAALVFSAGIASALNITVNKSVGGGSAPWSWANGGLNTGYQFATHFPYYSAPTVVSAADGFRFLAGDTLTIDYVSGLVAYAISGVLSDPLGDITSPLNDTVAMSYGPAPSYYMDPLTYPINLVELVGTFADNGGQIVGIPFAIGNSKTVTIPSGATRLQLGANDNLYTDNSGSWTIQVTGQAVPEPTTAALVLMSLAGIGFVKRRK